MAVTLPTAYPTIGAGGASQIAYLEPILGDTAEDLVTGTTHLYAYLGRRVLLERAWTADLTGTETSYALVGEATVSLSPGRSKLDLYCRKTSNTYVRIEIYDAPLTTLLASGEDTAGTTTGQIAIASGLSAGADAVVRLFARVPVSGTWGLSSYAVLERALTASELP